MPSRRPRASIIVPTHNRANLLQDALESALLQTVTVEVICVDDGSTDATSAILDGRYAGVRMARFPTPRGVAAARNRGLELATAPFVCFLDDDDILYPDAVALRLEGFQRNPDADWVFGDIKIIEVSGKTELASQRYDYAGKGLPGHSDLGALLEQANFIPVHAPLIRREALGRIRFPEGKTEDWAFWRAVAATMPARYVPHVVGEYRKRRGGRNAQK